MKRRQHSSGFSLITMSIILTAAAIVFVSFLPGKEAGDYNKKTLDNVKRLEKIEEAMRGFMVGNGRRPCPAQGSYDINAHNFGIEAANPGSCTGGTPAAPMGPDSGTGYIVSGTIPTKSLGLPDYFAFDQFGRRFTYVVDTRATGHSSCYALMKGGDGGLTVKDGTSGNTIDNVMYAYISHGPSGFGAFPAQGGTPGTRINTGSTDQDELTNAGVDSSFTYNTTNFTNVRIKKPRSSTFDDLVWYRNDLKNTCCIGQICTPTGFRINGSTWWAAGYSVAIGDINHDGIPDIIIGGAASVYVIFGTKTSFPNPFPLSSLNGTNGFVINQANFGDSLGSSLAVADVNGDGYPDIIIGAYGANGGGGAAFVVFGGPNAVSGGDWLPGGASSFSVSSLNGNTGVNGTAGFRIDDTTANDNAGVAVAAGDINADGKADVIIGAPTPYNARGPGKTFVVFGGSGVWPAEMNVSALNGSTGVNGTAGVEFDGVGATDQSGMALAAGDVNGDGKTDLIIGAMTSNGDQGNDYLVFGGTGAWTSPIHLSSLNGYNPSSPGTNGTNGTALLGSAPVIIQASGVSLATGDINKDGYADIIVGAPYGTPVGGNLYAGVTAFIFGGGGTWPASAAIASVNGYNPGSPGANGTNGILIGGVDASDISGFAVASGDVNADGYSDVIIGAPSVNNQSGATYVVFGSNHTWPSTMNLASLNGTTGVRLDGVTASDNSGRAVAYTGDVDGDGIGDILIGAYLASPNGDTHGGSAFLVFGRKTHWPNSYGLSQLWD